MDFIATSQQINTAVAQAKNVLVIGHQKPDADAIGSMVAVSHWLTDQGVISTIFCVDQPGSNLRWINNFEPVVTNPAELFSQQFDLVVMVDSGDLKYAGVDTLMPQLSGAPKIINIDHHFTNQSYGDINLVVPAAVSTTAVLYQFFKTIHYKISAKTASALLAGILFDTYNFTNPNTTDSAMKISSSLLAAGASLPHISDAILKTKTVAALKVWGDVLTRLRHNQEFNIASTVITLADLESGLSKSEMAEGVANFLNNLSGVAAVLILQELPDGMIKGSFRTNEDNVDVSALAKLFGGGGHKKAAGFKIKGKLVQDAAGAWQVV